MKVTTSPEIVSVDWEVPVEALRRNVNAGSRAISSLLSSSA